MIQFDFHTRRGKNVSWLVLEPQEASVCRDHPGFDVDLLVTADIAAFYDVWLGRITLAQARDHGSIQIDGPPALVRAFPHWLQLSRFADAVRKGGAREVTPTR